MESIPISSVSLSGYSFLAHLNASADVFSEATILPSTNAISFQIYYLSWLKEGMFKMAISI